MFGIPLGPLGMATMGDGRPDNSQGDTSALSKLYAAVRAANHTPNGRVARGFDQFGPQAPQAPQVAPHPSVPALGGLGLFPPAPTMAASPLQTAVATPAPLTPAALSAPVMASDAPVHSGWAGPHSVGGAPISMGPISVGGAPLGASGATGYQGLQMFSPKQEQATGPDMINKLMQYFHTKDQA